jgi:hypothetical protein
MEEYATSNFMVWQINDKDRHSFISFDIVDIYPSISEKLLNEALAYGLMIWLLSPKTIFQYGRQN